MKISIITLISILSISLFASDQASTPVKAEKTNAPAVCPAPTNKPPVALEKLQPPAKLESARTVEPVKPPAPAAPVGPTWIDGVRYGAIACKRNPDIDDLQALARIAFKFWQDAQVQAAQAAAQQAAAAAATPEK
jgi:hypothetical protein